MEIGSLTGPVTYTRMALDVQLRRSAHRRGRRRATTRRSADDVRAAVAAADAAPRPPLRDRDARAALLRGAAARLRAAGDEIVALRGRDRAAGGAPALGELERTAGQLEAFAAVLDAGDHVEAIIDTADPDATPIPRPDVRRMLVPIGPVAVFGASQLPARLLDRRRRHRVRAGRRLPGGGQGPPVAPGHRRARRRASSRAAAADAGLPEGTFAHLPAGRRRGRRGARRRPRRSPPSASPARSPAGRAIYDRAARRPVPIPVYAEMGSINPIVVTDGALAARADAIAEGLAASVANFGGQLCTKPGVVFVPAGASRRRVRRRRGRPARRAPSRRAAQRAPARRAAAPRRAPRRATGTCGALPAEAAPAEAPGFRHQPAAFQAPAAAVARRLARCWRSTSGRSSLLLRYDSRGRAARARSAPRRPAHRHAARRARTRTLRGARRRAGRARRAASSSTASPPASRSATPCTTAAPTRPRPRPRTRPSA